ncbi:hypothetical protein B0H14DRAFT_2590148 [Mycena olivaceomarginata]|nr:hypothetical protein B0H14DRAFT_2590148 [Mycena olivaceomarginata]
MYPPQTTRSEQAEKRRQRAAEYRQRPERREKQRVLMAERRYSCLRSGEFTAVKARRRRWDPPKVPKPRNPKVPTTRPPTPSPKSAHKTESHNSGDESESKSNASFTSAERFALGILAELKYALHTYLRPRFSENPMPAQLLDTTTGFEVGGIDPESHPTDGDIQMRYSSPSDASSVAAVHEEPVQPPNEQPRWITRRHTPLPGELGTVGPLTPIQVVQIKAFKLRRPSEYHEEEEPATPRPGPFLSTARWESIRWDVPVRQEFAEEALRRWRLSQMGRSSEQ